MIQNRELTMDDYMGMLRRRLWVILIPTLLAPALGFGISYLFPAKYTSVATVLVEGQKVPEGYVKPIFTEDLMQRVSTLQLQVLSRSHMQPVLERLGMLKNAKLDDVLDDVRKNVTVTPVVMDTSSGSSYKKRAGKGGDVPGFEVNYSSSDAKQAQQVCNELTSMLLEENLKSREQTAQGTTEFLGRQLDEAKKNLDEQDSKLAAFKRQYSGQLPGDSDNNLKILMGLNSQLDANTQNLNRAQQDKAYAESVLAQQVASWKASSQSSTSPQALEQQLAAMQSQLMQLQAKYTADHPDVVKAKADIAELKKRLNEVNTAKPDPSIEKASGAEPPEIRQLRVQIHQYDDAINAASADQKRLQEQIRTYQGRVALSPAVEEQYKELTRDYDTAQKFYSDLLAKKSDSEMTSSMYREQQGEQFTLANPASLPTSPSFPNRLLFAGGGLGVGLFLGLGLTLWLEMKDQAIRNELDVEAVMQLPMLISLPWLDENAENKAAKTESRDGRTRKESKQERVEV
jgi:polysaccharide chain length determinant protein (PEP-CTERM system associated)